MGDIPRSRFLERQEQQVRAGIRLIAAAGLLLVSSFVAGLALFGAAMRGLRVPSSERPDDTLLSAATVPPWLLVICAVVLGVALILQHRWVWPALGAWLTALTLTAAAVWAYSASDAYGFALFYTLIAVPLGAVGYWLVARFARLPN
ncbi:MAG TPA: hypothetical protein VJ650_12265 [Gemmatimonadaceae bacterium]|nr:hypothetical protein [Gemmatimonadaceae bacterium]